MNDCDAIPLYTAQARDEVIDPDFSSPITAWPYRHTRNRWIKTSL